MAVFGDLMSCSSKDIFKNTPFSCINIYYDDTDLVNQEMVKKTKTCIS